MIRTGFEPVLPPWKGGVLTTWPTDHINGEYGIRTHETVLPAYTISNRAPSASSDNSPANQLRK